MRLERDIGLHIAYRQVCLNAIEYLKKFGYSGAQAYSIPGTAPNFLCMPSDRRNATRMLSERAEDRRRT